jgi:site-specific DNA-methyltransferase (adenine-specific)
VKQDVMQQIEYVAVAALIPYARNARTHNDAQVAQIAASIREFGFTSPILIDGDKGIVAGHGRALAARKLDMPTVPCIRLDGMTESQKRAYIIADNKLALNAGWDDAMLACELADLVAAGYDVALTGFTAEELEALAPEEISAGLTDEDATPDPPETPVTILGDVWLLGKHRLMCGDSCSIDAVEKLMAGGQADMLLIDPPYNVAYGGAGGNAANKNKVDGGKRNTQTILNDDMSDDAFRQFLRDAFTTATTVMKPGAVFYIWHADSEGYNFRGACKDAGLTVRQCLIWKKSQLVMGRQDYHWKHEPCLYGWKDGAGHLWAADRKQTTILEFDKPSTNDIHPCLCPGTEVLTENGWRVIESLVDGDCVLAADGVFRSVELVSSHFIEKCVFRLAVSGVESAVDATDNHPFLVLRDGELAWIEASQIIVGDEICSPTKAMSENGTAIGNEWNTTSSGRETSEPSQTDIASITSTTTSKTITFQTYNLSPILSTSGFTPVATSAMAFGGSPAVLADHLNLLLPNTGISAQKDGPMDGAADRATSEKSYSFVLRSVSTLEKINYSGLVWNLSVKDSPTFETRIGMSHNTMKPVALFEYQMLNNTKGADVVLDLFGGSGTTAIACEKHGRHARLMELDPKYCDVICKRWMEFTGKAAILESTGAAFDQAASSTSAISQ